MLSVLAAVVAVYALTTLLPYVANGLHRLPLADLVSGRHDPKGLWPHGAVAGPVHGLSMLSAQALLVLPLVGAGWSAVQAVRAHRRRESRAFRLAVVAYLLCAGVATFALSPLGTSLIAWRMD